jgi:hypothetical protein
VLLVCSFFKFLAPVNSSFLDATYRWIKRQTIATLLMSVVFYIKNLAGLLRDSVQNLMEVSGISTLFFKKTGLSAHAISCGSID